MRRLIVNADDFGYTSGVNRAIVEAHAQGIVTSSTLMANGPAFSEAAQLTKNLPKLSVGCHVVLTDGQPILPAANLPSITTAADFRDGMASFAARAIAGRMDAREISAEAAAQIHKIQSAGISVSHIDTHKHTHLFPKILRPSLARRRRVRRSRHPQSFWAPAAPSDPTTCSRVRAFGALCRVRILGGFAGKFGEAVDREGFTTPDGTLGIVATGALDETLFYAIARSIPEGTWEFVCHPGYNDQDLQAGKTRLRESREKELHVLTLPAARHVLEQQGIELISYRELKPRVGTRESAQLL